MVNNNDWICNLEFEWIRKQRMDLKYLYLVLYGICILVRYELIEVIGNNMNKKRRKIGLNVTAARYADSLYLIFYDKKEGNNKGALFVARYATCFCGIFYDK